LSHRSINKCWDLVKAELRGLAVISQSSVCASGSASRTASFAAEKGLSETGNFFPKTSSHTRTPCPAAKAASAHAGIKIWYADCLIDHGAGDLGPERHPGRWQHPADRFPKRPVV
jgi:hypothetical protein